MVRLFVNQEAAAPRPESTNGSFISVVMACCNEAHFLGATLTMRSCWACPAANQKCRFDAEAHHDGPAQ
jgi:hypothetical protein